MDIKHEEGEKTMDCFIINNISKNDESSHRLRILKEDKPYFPATVDGSSQTYDIKVKVGSVILDSRYRFNRNRSGRLNLREELYKDILRINAGDILVIVVLEKNRLYQIINLRTLI